MSCERKTIFTDISNLDMLLENGIFEGDIIEELGTVYLDINNGFEGTRAHRILQERHCQDEDIQRIMERIVVEKVPTLNDLIEILEDLFEFLRKSNVKLLVLDSMSAIWFANLFSYKRTVKKIAQVVSLLRKLAHDFSLIVITINIFIDGFQEAKDNTSEAIVQNSSSTKSKPAMGKYWLTVPNTRLGVEKTATDSELKVSILKSNIYSSDEFCFINFSKSFIQ
ncbi:RAD51D family protein [Megaselia abdita]